MNDDYDNGVEEIINKEPETKVNIISQNGFVLIQFSSPVQNLKISKQQAKEMARRLVKECL